MTTPLEPVRDATVAVLLGGTSVEREVSLVSGRGVLDALEKNDGRGPAAVRRIEIDAAGQWCSNGRAVDLSRALELLEGIDVCFLALHGGDGEDGHLQAFLELAGVAFTGAGARASALAMDKWTTRAIAARAGLTVADACCAGRSEWRSGGEHAALELLARSPDGVCVKPRGGGSSVSTVRARTERELDTQALEILENGEDVLVERWTTGIEATCGVIGNRGGELRTLPPVEIRPHAGKFFDYEEKYSSAGAYEACPPEGIDDTRCEELAAAALTAHRELGCDGYSRTDFIVPEGSRPVFLETNSLPGMTPRSLLPLSAATAGLDFRTLCLEILALALARGGRR